MTGAAEGSEASLALDREGRDEAEQALRERLGAGDRDAFAEAADRFAPRLLGLVRRITLDGSAAEDVVQDTLLKLWTERARLATHRGSVLPWLRRVATNAALNYCERRRVRQRPIVDAPTMVTESPLAAAAETETRSRIEEAMDRLPAERRAVLALRVFEEMSYEEIASALSIAPGTVMSRLHRARLELREELRDLDPHAAPGDADEPTGPRPVRREESA